MCFLEQQQSISAWLLALCRSCAVTAATSGGAVLVHVVKVYIKS